MESLELLWIIFIIITITAPPRAFVSRVASFKLRVSDKSLTLSNSHCLRLPYCYYDEIH